MQIGQDTSAKAVVDHANEVANAATGGAHAFAVAAIPARYALERGAWAAAAALTPRPANTPYTEAITFFARAVGAARSGNPAAASADIERLAALGDKEKELKDAYWTEQIDIQRRVALAWQTFAMGNKEEGLAPARELFGYMLLDAGRTKEALVGGARAAETLGDRAKATVYYKKLLEVAKDADTERPELMPGRRHHVAVVADALGAGVGGFWPRYALDTYSWSIRCVLKNDPLRAMACSMTSANRSGSR